MADFDRWIGKDEHQGPPSLKRPDAPKSASWGLEAIAAVERPHDATLSPDGSMVAFVLDRDTSDIFVVPAAGGVPTRVTTGRELAAYWEDDVPAWAPDGSRLAYSSDGKVWTVPVSGGLPKEIAEGSSPLWADADHIILVADKSDESRLVRAATQDPWPLPITPPGRNVSGATLSTDHGLLLYVDHPKDDRQGSNIWLFDLEDGSERQLTKEPGIQDRGPRLSPSGETVAYTSEGTGWFEVYLVDVVGGEPRPLTGGDADFSELVWHPSGAKLLSRRTKRGVDDLVSIDTASGVVSVLAAGGEWGPVGWSGDRAVAIHEAHDVPPRLVSVDGDGGIEVLFESVPASIKAARHSPYEEITYESFDGTQIHGFLFKPQQAADGPVAAVVYPHGGPTSAYGDSWDGHAQYFVDKGYAWLAINFRGSTGYGRDFRRANFDVWGVDDTEDCLAAADFLAGLDWVDGNRIAIFGASYGAYLAFTSLARDPEHRFACGVAKYGDSDISRSWAQGDRGGREDIEKMMGAPSENRDAYRAGSPWWMAAQIERPLLITHGEQDIRVHPDQSEDLVAELKRLGKTFEYITYPSEGHGLLRAGPQVHFYERLERFLDWHLM